MNRVRSVALCLVLLYCWLATDAQYKDFKYNRSVNGIADTWHALILPDEMFAKLNADLSDLRIIGLHEKDTVEAPYLLKVLYDRRNEERISFRRINEGRTTEGYQYTFELPELQDVNEIEPFFNEVNFDWRVRVEASNDLKTWFTMPDEFRIVSMKNNDVDFQYTRLKFPVTKARYFRITIKTASDPKLTEARVTNVTTTEGKYRTYAGSDSIHHDKQNKQTIIHLKLRQPVPVSFLQLNVLSAFDYHRPIHIEALVDSVQTPNGWEYSYRFIDGGLLSSLIKEPFKFDKVITSQLLIRIQNGDNKPLDFSGFVVKGSVHHLVARFDEPVTHHLLYGNANASEPHYDIAMFENKIPTDLKEVSLGDETLRNRTPETRRSALFENKMWLWVAMGLCIVLLGVFTLKMMRSR